MNDNDVVKLMQLLKERGGRYETVEAEMESEWGLAIRVATRTGWITYEVPSHYGVHATVLLTNSGRAVLAMPVKPSVFGGIRALLPSFGRSGGGR